MLERWNKFKEKYPLPPLVLMLIGLLATAVLDKTKEWALAKAMVTPYLIPLFLFAGGMLWFLCLIFRPPKLEIVCDPSHHPFRQEFEIGQEHCTLFRIGVKNRSKFRAVNRSEVKLTATQPFMMDWVPTRLLLMNELPSAREFFLPPDGIQYVDVLQYNRSSRDLQLWHTTPKQDGRIERKDYTITITSYGDNTEACSREFLIRAEGDTVSFKPKASGE